MPKEKIRFIYKMFNCNKNYEITSDGLRMILGSCIRGYSIIKHIQCPSNKDIKQLYDEAMNYLDEPEISFFNLYYNN